MLHVDNLHCIDRLAVALGEAVTMATAPTPGPGPTPAPGPPAVAKALGRARAMLLHYAVLRKLFVHPSQRPGSVVPGLRAVISKPRLGLVADRPRPPPGRLHCARCDFPCAKAHALCSAVSM